MSEATGFADELRRLRTERGMSLAQLSGLAHYSKGYLSNVENGRKPVTPDLARRLDVVLDAGGALAGLVAHADREVCPYQGLASFGPDDARWFFGRERTTAALVSRAAECLDAGLPLVVFGASGAGKSSLLRAGLVPAVARGVLPEPGSADWPRLVTTPTAQPVPDLVARLRSRGVIVVDQFEEVFTACTDDERRTLIHALYAAAGEGALVVLGVRADFYGRCVAYPELLKAVQHNQFTVGAMTRTELVVAITAPAEATGLRTEPGLVELLLRDLGITRDDPNASYEPGALPLLSYALLSTWQQRNSDQLTVAGYQVTGGVDGAVAGAAERAYGQLGDEGRDAARRVLLRLVRVGEHGEATRRRVDRADLASAREQAAMEALAAVRLIVIDQDTVEITHEALLRAWPRLRGWLDENREGLRVHRQLTEAADGWESLDRDPGALYRGTRLALAREHVDDADLTERERRFMAASVDAEAAEQAAVRRRTRRQRQLIALLSVLLLLAVAASVSAIRAQNTVGEQRDTAIARKAIADAASLREENPALAVQLTLAAYRLAPSDELRDAVMSAFTTGYRANLTGHTSDVVSLAFAPDSPVLATISWDKTAVLWDVADVHHPRRLSSVPLAAAGTSAAFSPRDHLFATTDAQTLRVWDVSDPKNPREIAVLPGQASWVAFSPDGRTLATGHVDGTARMWNIDQLHRVRELVKFTAHTTEVTSVAFSGDGLTLATTGDTTARLWNVADGDPKPMSVLKGHSSSVRHAAFSPDGRTLATASWDHDVRVWDIFTGECLTTITEHDHIAWSVAFSPDGRTLATNGGHTILWDVTDRRNPRKLTKIYGGAYSLVFSHDGKQLASAAWVLDLSELPLTGHEDFVTDTRFSPDGKILASGGWDRSVRLWEPGKPHPIATLTGSDRFFRSVSFTPDGRTLAAAGEDGDIWLWDVSDPRKPVRLTRIQAGTGELAEARYSPDGTLLAAIGQTAVTLWDVRDGYRRLALLEGQREQGTGVTFSPDGRLLVASAHLTPGMMWDVTEPRQPRTVPLLAGEVISGSTFSPDGKVLAVSDHPQGGTPRVRLVDVRDLANQRVLAEVPGYARMAFSPDGRRLATAGDVRLYDVTNMSTPRELVFYQHKDGVQTVTFSPDSQTLVSGGNDSTVRLWETDFTKVTARVCDVAWPRITEQEWEKYLPGVDFAPPCGS